MSISSLLNSKKCEIKSYFCIFSLCHSAAEAKTTNVGWRMNFPLLFSFPFIREFDLASLEDRSQRHKSFSPNRLLILIRFSSTLLFSRIISCKWKHNAELLLSVSRGFELSLGEIKYIKE